MSTFRFQLRRGSTAQWAAANPVLAAGEPGVDLDTGALKIGDGATAWADLPGITGTGAGADGLSAYELAVAAGFVGTLEAWLDSLVGPAGPPGADGADGADGAQGPPGADGADGAQGPPGADGADGAQGPPGPTAVSADAGNAAVLGSDDLLFVPEPPAGGGASLDTTAGAATLLLGSTDAGTATQNTGILVLGMVIVPVDLTFTSIGCEVTTGASGSTVTLALCTRVGSTLTKVFESSALSSATAGVKSQTGISQALPAGVYWVGSMSAGGAPQVRRMAPPSGSWATAIAGSITTEPLPFVYVSPEAPPLASSMTINEGTNALQPAIVRLGGVTY